MKKWLSADGRFHARLLTIGLLVLLCLPSLALDIPDDKGQKSSRKNQNNPPTETESSKPNRLELGEPSKSEPSKSEPSKSQPSNSEPATPADKPDAKADNDKGPVKLTSGEDGAQEGLSIEQQQKKDQGECPGSEGSKVPASQNLNDIPLEQDEHPFDAPSAETEEVTHDDAEDAGKVKPVTPTKPEGRPAQTETARRLETRINTCLAYYYMHPENLTKRSPWAVMHTILPFGVETEILAGNRQVNAIGWMCYNGVCKTQRMFQSTQSGFRTNVGPGVQGHEGQFLAILAQSSVPRNFPIVVGKNRYTVNDLIRYEMATCREKSELTFKLIGLSHYLSPKQTWRDDHGRAWNLEKLVREELDQPIVGAACGGTHRLMGLSYALMMRRRYEQPITGHWARADVYLQDFVKYAWTLQNPDGSFSTDWFEGRANEPDMERKVQTTGHILEWLIFTLPADELDDPRVLKSLEFLLSQVYDHRDKDWPIGPRGHSLRAISLYNQRVFGAPTGQLKTHMAEAGYLKKLR